MADYAGLDYDQLAQAYMRLLEERGSGFRGIPYEGAAYRSKDPGNERYAEGEVSRDVGLLDPVDMLAGAVSAGSSRLLPAARQLRTWYHGYDPARVKALIAQSERDSWIEVLKSIQRDNQTRVRPMIDLPAKPPTPAPTFPMEGDADLWLAERLRDLTRWRTGEDDVMRAAQNAIPEFDVSMDQVAKNTIADALRVSGGRSAPHPYLTNPAGWREPPLRVPPAGGYGGFAPKSPKSPTPLSEISLEELLPRRPGQGDDQLLLAEFLEDYSRVLRGEPSTTLPRAPGAEPPDRLEALEILRSHIDSMLWNMDIPGGGMHRPPGSGGQP